MIRDGRPTRAGHELTRKEMKGPDRFQVAAARGADWMASHRRAILGTVAAAAVVGVGGFAGHTIYRSRLDAAGGGLYRALDAADGQISPVPLPGVDRPVFPTDAERQRAVVAAADAVRKGHSGSRAAATAALVAGQAHLRLREWDAAGAAFQEYLAATPPDDPLRFAALDGLARVQEGKGDLAAAAQAYERAGREAAFHADRVALERARVLARAGKVDEARKILQGFPGEFKESPLQEEAKGRLGRLAAK